jgi:glutamyl-tRNA reductase
VEEYQIIVAGLNHKSAPVSVREKITIRPEEFPKALGLLRDFREIRESAILSTCNRTEIYAVANPRYAESFLPRYLGEFRKVPVEFFSQHLYQKEGLEAARHLFSVTAGLDSLVIGEDQILGQVKQSFKMGQEMKSLGVLLHRLFQSAIEAGKRIRNETALGENPGSVGEAAVDLAKRIFGNLKEKTILILGAGEMGKVVAEALIESGVSHVMVCSRTFESAKSLADQFNATPFTFEALHLPLENTDILISAVTSPEPLLKRQTLEEIMRRRRQSPLFVVDIAVPRNVEESAGKLENLYLYNIDDLKQIVRESNQAFQNEIAKAWKIVEEEVQKFFAWQQSRMLSPTLKEITENAHRIKEQELQKFLAKFPNVSPKEKEAVEILAHTLVNKILHKPLVNLKAFSDHPLGYDYVAIARHLFGLDDGEETP